MRYYYSIPSLLLIINLFIGCNLTSENSVLLNKAGVVSEESAVAIIHYNNGLVQLTDAQLEYITYVNRNLKHIEKGLETPEQSIMLSKLTDVFYFNIKELSDVNKELPRSVFDVSQISFFEKNVVLMNQTFEEVRMTYQNLENYILNDEYQTDKGVLGQNQIEQLKKTIDEYYVVSDLVMNKIVALSDEAEKEILKDHPLKDFIFSMQECSDIVSYFVDRVDERPNQFEEDKAVYRELILDMKTYQNKISKIDPKPLETYSEKRVFYEGFLGALNDFIIHAEKNVEISQKTGKFTNEQLSELLISEEFLRNFYNDFVD